MNISQFRGLEPEPAGLPLGIKARLQSQEGAKRGLLGGLTARAAGARSSVDWGSKGHSLILCPFFNGHLAYEGPRVTYGTVRDSSFTYG